MKMTVLQAPRELVQLQRPRHVIVADTRLELLDYQVISLNTRSTIDAAA
jgi:hypothetical protein